MNGRSPGWEERITRQLLKKIEKAHPEEYKRFWDRWHDPDAEIDIDTGFVGFIDVYFFLSKIIPQNRVVFDVGCAYSFQSYYFRDHYLYVGVDGGDLRDRLILPGTKHTHQYINSAEDLRELHSKYVPRDRACFAICSYVPSDGVSKAVKDVFPDCFTLYPRRDPDEKRML